MTRIAAILVISTILLLGTGCELGQRASVPDESTPIGTQRLAEDFAQMVLKAPTEQVEQSPSATAELGVMDIPNAPPTAAAPPTAEPGQASATGESGPMAPIKEAVVERGPAPSPTPTASTKPTKSSRRVVALDPGHGGPESGAAAAGLVEKDVNLKIALKLAGLLRAGGYEVVLTRDSDRAVSAQYQGDGYRGALVADLQGRVDIANAAAADIFISIHNNGSGDPGQSGTEVWYNRGRSFAERNAALARLVEDGLVRRIRALGYSVVERGIKDDDNFRVFQGRVFNIFVLGQGTGARPHTPTEMPGVLGESLFLSNAGDATMLRQERTLDAIAAGYQEAITAYFERYKD